MAVNRWTRWSLLLQVSLVVVLSGGAALLLGEVASWDAFRFRTDLTFQRRNTLDPALDDLLGRLPERVTAETFFQALSGDEQGLWVEAQQSALKMLQLAAAEHPDRFELVRREEGGLEGMRARLEELGLPGQHGNVVIVSMGERREVLQLFGDLTSVQVRQFGPAITEHRGELALATALASVSIEGSARILFSTGHGELDLQEAGAWGLTRLRSALETEGLRAETFDLESGLAVPDDCEVLAILGATDPLSAGALDRVRSFTERGGRLLIALGPEFAQAGDPATGDLLPSWGMGLYSGVVCQPVINSLGAQFEGVEQCQWLRVPPQRMNAQHPVTEPLRGLGRSVALVQTRAFERLSPPRDGVLLDLFRSADTAWRDLPTLGRFDWSYDNSRESIGAVSLGMTLQYPPDEGEARGGIGEEIPEARVAALGTRLALANEHFELNRDFVLNLFNWLAEREFRLSVSIRNPEASRIDVRRGLALPWVNRVGIWGLPGLCALLGIFTAWRRRH